MEAGPNHAESLHGWRLLSVSENLDTGTAAGRMVVTILAALAQMEREQIGERTSVGMSQVAAEGRARSSRLPFGYRVKGSADTRLKAGDRSPLVKHAGEQRVLREMLALRESGLGARRIARTLNEGGVLNPRTGGEWNFGTVASILRTVDRRREEEARQPKRESKATRKRRASSQARAEG